MKGKEPAETAKAQDDDRPMMTALSRGIRVLQCFSTLHREMDSRELMAATGLPRPTVFRITNTLCQLGLLHYSESRQVFRPTISMLTLAASVLARLSIRQLARPLLKELAEFSQGQALLSVGEGAEVVIAETALATNTEVFRLEVGTRLSLTHSASGLAYLYSLPEADRDYYIHHYGQDTEKRSRIISAAFEDLRTKGYCVAARVTRPDIIGIASPLRFNSDGQHFILSVAILPFDIDEQRVNDMGIRVSAFTRNLEVALGDIGDLAQAHPTQRISARR